MFPSWMRSVVAALLAVWSTVALAVPPTASTGSASSLTISSALLSGSGTPGGEATTGWFRLSATNPVTCNDTFGTRVPASGGTDLGAGTSPMAYSISATGLTAGVTYWFCAIVQNPSGTAFGAMASFTVPSPPITTTSAPTSVTATAATLEGAANPMSSAATGWFRYASSDPGACNDSFGTRTPSSGGTSLGSGVAPVTFNRAISGLTPGATVWYCAIAQNGNGTSFGTVQSFTTPPAQPTVSTGTITPYTGTTATFTGSANPGGGATTGWFRYDTVSPGACNDTFGTRTPTTGGSSLGSGNSSVPFNQAVSGLAPATTYYVCAIAQNSAGTGFGVVQTFTTAAPPTAVTVAATYLANTSATLNGTGNPGRAVTTGWFRFSTTNPGTCNDSFGSRAPSSSGSSLGSGSSVVAFGQTVNGLSANTTYWFCAITQSAEGTAFGELLSFTTLDAPVVTTNAAASVASTSASLSATVNPRGASGTAWFRYASTDPGACNDTFGTRAPTSGGTSFGAVATDVPVTQAVTGLLPGVTYYACALAQNAYGTSFGAVVSFSTPAAAPTVTTQSVSTFTSTTATLRGTANPGGAATTGWFRYATTSPGTCNDSFGTRAPSTDGAALGSGNSSVAFSQAITGLLPATTYYVCAIAQNSVGTTFGLVQSFVTATTPVATTEAASGLSNSGATLSGTGNPNRAAATGWFRYSATNPGTCDDAFGSRAPSSGGTSLGSGSAAVSFSQSVGSLSARTTYYYCAIVQTAEGTAFGSVQSFTTQGAPTATTNAPTLVTSSSATLQGAGNPGGVATTGWFRYATSNPGSCNDSFGTRTPSSGGASLGATFTDATFAQAISGLTPVTTYYVCAITQNTWGTAFGAVQSFTTTPTSPTVSTLSTQSITGAGATLRGSANPGGGETTGWFRYSTVSPGTCNDTFGTRAPTTGGSSLGSGTASVAFTQAITGLSPGVTYYACAIAQNAGGIAWGGVTSFTTPVPPVVTTNAATSLSNTSVTLNGVADPSRAATTAWFRYSTTNPGTCDDSFGSRAPTTSGTAISASSGPTSFGQSVGGLSPFTTYWYCAIAQNSEGTSFGALQSFTTYDAPVVTTGAPTSVASTSATLQGVLNPRGVASTGWFRYSTTNPGACNDSFGTRAPTSSGSSVSAGVADVPYAQAISGLLPGATYYVCAIGQNSYGTVFGAVQSFTTPARAPIVTTSSANTLTGTGANLRGSADPGGAETTAWFRYATASPGTCNDTFGTRAPATGGDALGAGNTAVAFAEAVTGLSPGTTYYVCAIAQNSAGTGFGLVQSFTTPTPPTVTTSAASALTNTSATLNGAATPNLSSTTGYFRYSATNPVTCDDTFGSRAPTSSGSALGSGSSPVSFSQSVSGLSANTTYYFCAIAQSAEGVSFGAVLSFTTLDAPTVTTNAATLVTSNGAQLNGTANPRGASGTGWFRFHTTNPGTCTDTGGTRAPSSSGSALSAVTTDVSFAQSVAGLLPGATYYVCAFASNAYGTAAGTVQSFTTLPALPTVATGSATLLTGTTATLNGSANPGGAATTGWYRYSTVSPGTCNDTFGTRAPAAGGSSLGSGNVSVAYSQAITGLTAGTTYYVCAIAQNSVGTNWGVVQTFVTPLPPVTTTSAATSITNTGALLNGTANPNRAATTGYFRYGTSDPGTCSDSFGSRLPSAGGVSLGSGTSNQAFSQSVAGLSPSTTYWFCAVGTSAEGTSFGAVLSFTTLDAPVVGTSAATLVTATSATLNGSADPKSASTTGWFRYATTNPGTCNDTFGTRAPSSSGTGLGAGVTPVSYSQPITGLLPGTTYWFCAIASNAYGTGVGPVLSFTTPPQTPVVTTNAATLLTGTTATVNASANPGGDAATGWFRYATTSPGSCNDSFGTRAPATGGAALASSNSTSSFSQALTGLTAGTTYYVCAIVQNSVGTGYGAVTSFTTPLPPTVTTGAASSVTNTTATLNASGNPNRAATTGWFRFGTTDPGTCDDSFGSRAPSAGGSSLGSGASTTSFSQAVTGLSPNTTYWFCAVASSAEGTAFGAPVSFTTLDAPAVTTLAATTVNPTTATLNGSANPRSSTATGWFRYATTNPGTCNDSFGARAPSSSGSALGAGTAATPYAQPITGLLPGTTYWVCAIASNAYGTGFGTPLSFTTPAQTPTVATGTPTGLSATGATLAATVNPGGGAATAWFRYDTANPTTCNDTFGTRAPSVGGTALPASNTTTSVTQAITGLTAGTTYYVCAVAENTVGKGFGAVVSFTTPVPPTAVTVSSSSVTNTTVTLNGSGNPNRAATTGYFRYGTSDPGTCSDAFGSRAPSAGGSSLGSGSTAVSYSQAVTGLLPNTTYWWCAATTSAEGLAFGAVASFTTLGPPTVTTSATTLVTATSATLNASTDPNGATTTGWFRYGTSNPGTCSDSFGTRAPSSSGAALGAGTVDVPYAQAITGLVPGQTYWVCALSSNAYGTSVGAPLSFTTPPQTPTVATNAPTGVTGTTATLAGTANPGGGAATGWFRYDTSSPGTCNDSFGTRVPETGGSALGAGNTSVSFGQAVSGLVPATTYYVCAVAQNSVGTSFGAVVSFTTASAPSVTTNAPTAVTNVSATLNGVGVANRLSATGYFRYGAIDPGTCSDSFGTRAPTSGGTALGSGTTNASFSQSVTGLTANTTYYACAVATNAEGTTFGAVVSFTTLGPPTVTTDAVSALTGTTGTLNGRADPNGAATTGWFRYGTSNPGTCSDGFGTRAPASSGTALGAGSVGVAYGQAITGLVPGTTYWACALASNAYGTSVGAPVSFTAPVQSPVVSTSFASSIGTTTATLGGQANPGGGATVGWLRYGTTNPGTCDDSFGTRVPATSGTPLGSGTVSVPWSQPVSGLTPGATYYVCAFAQNSAGTGVGGVVSFTTAEPPAVVTFAADPVTGTTATLSGAADPNGFATTGYFRYGTTNPITCDDSFGTRAPSSSGTSLGSGTTTVGFSQAITGLQPATTYWFCAAATSSVGTSFGPVVSFATPAVLPTATTLAASSVGPTQGTLNGTGAPGGAAATGWFRWSTTSPGTCNDSFGTRTPASGGVDLGAGAAAAPFSQALTGLTVGQTVYYCAIVANEVGTAFGAVASFTTTSAPSVTTDWAQSTSGTAATLYGSANPNASATTGWFRYATTNPGTCNDSFGVRAPSSSGTALGAGTATQAFSQAITGLQPNTTYHFCAIAQNASGLGFGSVVSITTRAAPVVVTGGTSGLGDGTVTLEGTADPNLATTTGFFRYGRTNPGTCTDAFGSRAPSAGGSALGVGTDPVAFTQTLTGLVADSTYWYCAGATNSEGTVFGAVRSFQTAAVPVVTTGVATSVTTSTATLGALAVPGGVPTTGWLRYATTNPGTCSDGFGVATPAVDLGSGRTSVGFPSDLTGLQPATTYWYCAIARNVVGTGFGAVLSFTTPDAPDVVSVTEANLTTTQVTLRGSALPNGLATTGWFRYATVDPGSCSDAFGTRLPDAGGDALGAGFVSVPFERTLTGLQPGATYWWCALASNAEGAAAGEVRSFTVPSAPTGVTTFGAIGLLPGFATLRGEANPAGTETTGWFRYGTVDPGTCSDAFGTRLPSSSGTALGSGTAAVAYSLVASGLQPDTTYFYCAAASSSWGTRFGEVRSFTTPDAPTVVTTGASSITGTAAVLGGEADPNQTDTEGWFRYASSPPAACDDSFGTRTPSSAGVALGAGFAPVPYTQGVTGLQPGTTYFYCAIARNTWGTRFGAVRTFTTPQAPTVATYDASDVAPSSATLQGAAVPNGAPATAWFQLGTSDPGACSAGFGTRTDASPSALGSGASWVAFSAPVTGLQPQTTYWYCAAAESSVGVTFGDVRSFTTPEGPAVTTVRALALTGTTARLEGEVNPNGSDTTGWFRVYDADPGACVDAGGERVPTSGGALLGAGAAVVPYARTVFQLQPGTRYWACALAANAAGTAVGEVLSFTTPSAPVAVTLDPAGVEADGATLRGSVDAGFVDTSAWFRISDVDPGGCNDAFGTRAPASGAVPVGADGDPVVVAQGVDGLEPATTYWTCVIAESAEGRAYGDVVSFTTPGAAPYVVTEPATDVLGGSAVIHGTVDPNGAESGGWFRLTTTALSSCDDTIGDRYPPGGSQALGGGNAPIAFSEAVGGLTPGVTYTVCAFAENAFGVSAGEPVAFTAGAQPPVVVTEAATDVAGTTATLHGLANPRGLEANGWFRYGDVDPGVCDDAFGTRTAGFAIGGGGANVAFDDVVTGLLPNATYFFCAAADTLGGTTYGEVATFTTLPVPPVVRTLEPETAGRFAALAGAADPQGSLAEGWFRIAQVAPDGCDDAFGLRVPDVGGVDLGDGRGEVGFQQAVSDLEPGTWYGCALAANEAGVAVGEVVTFVVPEIDDPDTDVVDTDDTDADTDTGAPTTDDPGPKTCGGCDTDGGAGAVASVVLLALAAATRRRQSARESGVQLTSDER